jgi:hypothetical protein
MTSGLRAEVRVCRGEFTLDVELQVGLGEDRAASMTPRDRTIGRLHVFPPHVRFHASSRSADLKT